MAITIFLLIIAKIEFEIDLLMILLLKAFKFVMRIDSFENEFSDKGSIEGDQL
jgi:hypothetical protein